MRSRTWLSIGFLLVSSFAPVGCGQPDEVESGVGAARGAQSEESRAVAAATQALIRSEVVTLVRDSQVRVLDTNANHGANPRLLVRRSRSNEGALVGFDLTGLDREAVRSAQLVMTVHPSEAPAEWRAGEGVEAYRLVDEWVEGTGNSETGARGEGSGVTFNCAIDTNIANTGADCAMPWSGANLQATPTAMVPHQNAMTGEVGFDVTADVREHGASSWFLKATARGGKIYYYSREGALAAGNEATAPRLLLEVEEPDEPQPLAVHITSPASLITVGAFPIEVTGTVSSPSAVLTVNGVAVDNAGGTFSAAVALEEGHNTIVARAVEGDAQATDSISVSLDLTPPYVTIESHVNQQTVYTSTVTITGLINDIVRGTVEQTQAVVTVNGLPATISNRSYAVANVPLTAGDNLITVLGTDQVGNVGRAEITLRYVIPVGRRLELASGDEQVAHIATILPSPLVVRVLDDALAPVADAQVVFRVTQGSGAVAAGSADEARAVVVQSDAQGLARTEFRLGMRSGTANHKVSAQVVGYDADVVFHASALANIGNKISVNSGNNQRGGVGQVLPEPMVVVVTDDGANVVQGARVRFEVTRGGGTLSGGGGAYETQADSDGRAIAEYTLGALQGLDAQRITATLLDAPAGQIINAGFTASAFVPGDPGQTSISGVVLDNQDTPLPGVTIRVGGSTRQAVTNEHGQFRITEAPVGPVHLVADGSTTTADGEYPSLSYNIVTIAGVDNPLAAPIYMVKLDTDSAVYAGPQDAALELPDYPGFKLEIAAGSVTFPDGAREGLVSVTPVNTSKIPMAPPNGMQPQFIVTIQPTNTRFDPPARMTLPNVDGHPPGTQAEMYSYDHDLEEFVSIGLGTVSEDGSVITSNPGVGVIKAGWHCGSQPTGQGCASGCPVCQDCDSNCNCVPAAGDPRLASLDTAGDCRIPECQGGGVVQSPHDGDVPTDTAGDCHRPECNGGVLTQVPDDADLPSNATCKECVAGALADQRDTPISTPAASAGPSAMQIGWSSSWGANSGHGYNPSFACQTVCVGGDERYGLIGDITPSSSWVVEVSTILRAPNCAEAPRTAANIQRTTTHELRHTAYLMSVINDHKARIGVVYPSAGDCDAARSQLTQDLQSAWSTMVTRQQNHTDFSGETTYCESCSNNVSVEVSCGTYP